MASSDDENGENEALLPNVVSYYYFLDDNMELISISELPLIWEDGEKLDGNKKKTNLYGTTDNGFQKIFEQVTAWKFNCSSAKLEIFVLSKKKNLIKLLKPRKIFEEPIKTTLITLHCLHILKRNPKTIGKALWDLLYSLTRGRYINVFLWSAGERAVGGPEYQKGRGHLEFICRLKDYLPRSKFINRTINAPDNHFSVKSTELEEIEPPSNVEFEPSSRLLERHELEEATVDFEPEKISLPV